MLLERKPFSGCFFVFLNQRLAKSQKDEALPKSCFATAAKHIVYCICIYMYIYKAGIIFPLQVQRDCGHSYSHHSTLLSARRKQVKWKPLENCG